MEGKGTGENMGLKEKVQDMMERAVSDCVVAGINLLVEKDGRELCYCQAGMADREENRPMERDTIFRLYSQTKPVAAAAAMILMERGQMDLIQPVSDFLPSFAGQSYSGEKAGIGEDAAGAGVSQPVRIFDLLRMTSGLVYPDEAIQAGRETAAVFEEIDRRLRSGQDMTTREVAERLAGRLFRQFPQGEDDHFNGDAEEGYGNLRTHPKAAQSGAGGGALRESSFSCRRYAGGADQEPRVGAMPFYMGRYLIGKE